MTRDAPEYIGVAWIESDGTIKLRLRAEDPRGLVGDALLAYPLNHPQYQSILSHVGPLKVGEHKLVRPWPD